MVHSPSRGAPWAFLGAALVAGSVVAAAHVGEAHASQSSVTALAVHAVSLSPARIMLSSPLSLSTKSVQTCGQVAATVTLQNQGGSALALTGIVAAARTPAGANADFPAEWGPIQLAPGQSFTYHKTRNFTSSDPAGAWDLFASYRTSDNVWHPIGSHLALTVQGAASTPPTTTPVPPSGTPAQASSTPAKPSATAVLPSATPAQPTATTAQPSATAVQPSVTATSAPANGSIALGATIHDNLQNVSGTLGAMDWYAGLVGGQMPAIVNVGGDWVHNANFDPQQMSDIRSRGSMGMWTWMPEDYSQGNNQPGYRMRDIANGAYDSYVRQFATAAKNWGHPFLLRFAHEMNGGWYPWGTGPGGNGTTPSDFVAAWRHVHDIFTSVGATNVLWVWCANVSGGGLTPDAQDFPGDKYVDWVALDGYNWGGSNWQSLYNVFNASYNEVTALSSKPVMITETSSSETGGSKADWITQGFLHAIPTSFPRIRAVVWFDWTMEHDWRVNSSPSSLAAFQAVAASPLYQGKLPQ
ncbi:MAG: beta-mannanase [Chloroflexi bacterium]|nr:beta-mannanase [Chloroflexota bacterium]